MSLNAKESERIQTALQQPGAVLHDGGFYLLFKYGRWHLMTIGYTAGPNARQYIQTLKFMNEAEVDLYLSNHSEVPTVEQCVDMFEGFEHEVAAKVLNTPDGYEAMILSGMLQAMTGFTTDTMQVSNIGARGPELKKAMHELMQGGGGLPSVILHFSRPAVNAAEA